MEIVSNHIVGEFIDLRSAHVHRDDKVLNMFKPRFHRIFAFQKGQMLMSLSISRHDPHGFLELAQEPTKPKRGRGAIHTSPFRNHNKRMGGPFNGSEGWFVQGLHNIRRRLSFAASVGNPSKNEGGILPKRVWLVKCLF